LDFLLDLKPEAARSTWSAKGLSTAAPNCSSDFSSEDELPTRKRAVLNQNSVEIKKTTQSAQSSSRGVNSNVAAPLTNDIKRIGLKRTEVVLESSSSSSVVSKKFKQSSK
jgi:hypothetical protein